MDSFNSKRKPLGGPLARPVASYSMGPGSYFYSQETGKNYTATPQGIAMYAEDLARVQNGVDRDGLRGHVRNMMDDTRVIKSHGAHDVLRVGGSRIKASESKRASANRGRYHSVPVYVGNGQVGYFPSFGAKASMNPKRDSLPAFASAETGAEYPLSASGIKKYLEDYDEWVGMLDARNKIAKQLKEILQPVPGFATDVDIGDLHDSLEVLR